MLDLLGTRVSKEISWLGRQLRPFVTLLLWNLACILIGSVLALLDPLVVKWLIDFAVPKHDLRLVVIGTLTFCAIYLASIGLTYVATFISGVVAQRLVFRIRVSLLRRIHALPAGYHSKTQVGDLLFRIEQDVARIGELSGDILPVSIQMMTMGILVLLTMGTLNWRLTTLVIPLLPIFYLLQSRYSRKLKEAADNAQKQSGKITAFLQEHLAGLLQLHLLNRTARQGARFARLAAAGAELQIQQRATEMCFAGASITVIIGGMGLILGYGGLEVARGALSVGGLVAFYGYVFRLFAPISVAVDLQSRLQRAGASIRRIFDLMETPLAISSQAGRAALGEDTKPDLEFCSVYFSYDSTRPVLRDMTFRVDAGETVALVGLNGSGKSTVGFLSTKLYEPDSGSIFVGGHDIKEVSRRNLRAAVTLIPQDPILFNETVRENLLYGNPRATDEDLNVAIGVAQLETVLSKLPKGLDEPLGPLGGKLSGGEKKRIALARTLLQGPRILIVDEITSALDAPTTDRVLRAMEQFRGTRTLVVISHRPAAILWADRILVIDQGSIVDSGKHSDLMGRCASYRRIWQAQDTVPSIELSLWNQKRDTSATAESSRDLQTGKMVSGVT